MSLVRLHDRYRFERSEGAYFYMTAGGTSILCMVSHEALRDRSARDGDAANLRAPPAAHRDDRGDANLPSGPRPLRCALL